MSYCYRHHSIVYPFPPPLYPIFITSCSSFSLLPFRHCPSLFRPFHFFLYPIYPFPFSLHVSASSPTSNSLSLPPGTLDATVISQAEYEWDGDPRRGVGDYRIPVSLRQRADGSEIEAVDKFPNKGRMCICVCVCTLCPHLTTVLYLLLHTHTHHLISSLPPGIVRDSSCTEVPSWQAWKCNSLSHRMMVIESMDSDTEVRRLSPIALIANPGEAR